MSFSMLLALIAASLLAGFLARGRVRTPLLLGASILGLFVLQPSVPIRGLDFWLPSASLALACLVWVLVTPRGPGFWRTNAVSVLLTVLLVLGLALLRLSGMDLLLPSARTPSLPQIGMMLIGTFLAALLLGWLAGRGRWVLALAAAFLLLIFLVLKLPALNLAASLVLRSMAGQSTLTASALDIRWLGYSYIAFRLLHVLRDRQNGRLAAVKLGEFLVYVLFFPALAAGPIDRVERFVKELRDPARPELQERLVALRRILLGLFKKFVLADGLALLALNPLNAGQVHSAGWAWVLLYAFALQIYFDFSGYTDLAVGMGQLMGFHLPENFNRPLARPNLTLFWNNWHMSLTQWFRAYCFNPLTRALRSRERPLPVGLIILLAQLATMLLIGLWHGVTWNFVLWGVWHGVGLFVHNRWAEWSRARPLSLPAPAQAAASLLGTLVTFHYVALGWVFFALPSVAQSLAFFGTLFLKG